MKNSLTSLIIIVSFLYACNSDSTSTTIKVKDYRTTEQPEINLDNHKKGEVAVHRVLMPDGESYEMIYFHDYSGKLNDYHAFYQAPDDFDIASYNWNNDTSVTFTLINSSTQNNFTLHLFANGATSGLRIDD